MNIKLFRNFFCNLRNFLILSLCKLLKYNLEHTLTIIKGDKIIIETLIYHNNKLVGEYTFI
jgi:hypothetical protein